MHDGYKAMSKNAVSLNGRHKMKVQDVFPVLKQLVEQGAQFDLIMADPPFGEKNINKRSQSLSQRLLDVAELPKY
jgi:23S rRNA G2069 N7-methylase RlmK/C1962 C5-methylase RlmI